MSKRIKIALVGNPNCGKTTLFNKLTGLNQKAGNFPGVTVEKRSGLSTMADGQKYEIIDLPGSYSLSSTSPDESVVQDILLNRKKWVLPRCSCSNCRCYKSQEEFIFSYPDYRPRVSRYCSIKHVRCC